MSPALKKRAFTANKFQDAILVLSDGDFWLGKGLGALGQKKGEICFNVSMTGYQEIMMDPSYAEQIICFTFPHIGNTGCNTEDEESHAVFCQGLVVNEPITPPSNFRSTIPFDKWLEERQVTGLSGVDTRSLTCNIRNKGPRSALLYYATPGELVSLDTLIEEVKDYPTLLGQEIASKVSTDSPYCWEEGVWKEGQKSYSVHPQGTYHVVAIDFGIKRNILRCLVENDFKVTVIPAQSSFEEIMAFKPDGIFLSNGPGDPFATSENTYETIQEILDKNIPLFGICLGNQLLAIALGLNTLKLNCGHRGSNHPVKNLKTERVEITSQNHGFCVSRENIPDFVEITHESLFDGTIEGIRHRDKHAFAIQYHPESSPGPHDGRYLFKEFYTMIETAQRSSS